jgi:hypothetical protein
LAFASAITLLADSPANGSTVLLALGAAAGLAAPPPQAVAARQTPPAVAVAAAIWTQPDRTRNILLSHRNETNTGEP